MLSLLLLLILLFHFLASFSPQRLLLLFHWSLSDSNYPQVFRILLGILADLSNVVVWVVSILRLITSSPVPTPGSQGPFRMHQLQMVLPSSLCSTVFFSVLQQGPSICQSFRFLFFFFSLCRPPEKYNPQDTKFSPSLYLSPSLSLSLSLFILGSIRLVLLTWNRWSDLKISRTDSCVYIYHLVVWSSFNLFHNSQWITFPAQSYLLLYFFCDTLLDPLTMLLIVSSFFST